MMIDEIMQDTKAKMEKSTQHLKKDFSTMRTGRASASILDPIKVDYYGTKSPINQIAGISIPEARLIVIKPWDKNALEPIKKAILTSDIGINPIDDGNVIRLAFPQLTEETRKKMVKIIKQKGEDTKIAIRNIRRDSNSLLQDLEKESEITEDDYHKHLDEVQKLTDKFITNTDEIVETKEKDILEI